jgi:16S rRNA processing protein RimM
MVGHSASEIETRTGVDPGGWVEVGRVLRPRGLDGSLLVQLHGEEPDNLLDAESLQLSGAPGSIPFSRREAEAAGCSRDGRARVRLWLVGVESRVQADVWTGSRVAIPESALHALPEGEFYWREILGLHARGPEGRVLGVIEEIWPTAGCDLLVIRDGETRLLIPAAGPLLTRVDLRAGEVWLDPPPELLDREDS